MRAVFVCCLFLAGLVSGVPSARAEAPRKISNREARKLYEEGNKLYNVRAFAEAAEKYKAAAIVEAAPVLDFNLGQCYRQLGKYDDAIWHYQRFLETGQPAPEKRATVEKFIEQMRDELGRKAMSQPPTAPDASASEGAPSAGSLPSPAPIAAGSSPAGSSELDRTATTRDDDGAHTKWFWLGVGLTSAGILGGGGTAWLAVTADRMEAQSKETGRTTSERLDLADRADSRRSNALIVGIASGITLGLGVVTLAVAPRVNRRASGVAFSVGFIGNGVALAGRF